MTLVTRRLTTIIVLIISAVGGALLFEALLSIGSPSPFAHTRQGHLMGWAGLGVILLVFVYPIKKRLCRNDRWPRGWFQVHITAGVIGPLLIVLHSGAHVHALVPQLALAAMAIVAVSGIVGQGVHYLALRTLNDRRQQLHEQGLSPDEIDVRLRRMAAQEEGFRLWQAVHAPMTLIFLALTAMHVAGALYFGGM
ncbi:MAG TPA: hypothetical protein VKP13_07800 [Nitrospira sp.]|nr:hypothetical protein [Nitrospira sp.]